MVTALARGYWGTVVVARPRGLLVDQDGVTGFGHQQHLLRELGVATREARAEAAEARVAR